MVFRYCIGLIYKFPVIKGCERFSLLLETKILLEMDLFFNMYIYIFILCLYICVCVSQNHRITE